MGGILRRGVQRALDHLGHLCVRHRAWTTGAVFVGEPFDPIFHEPPTPLSDGVFMHPEPGTDLLALQAFRAEQYHAAPIGKRPRSLVPPNLRLQKGPLLIAQDHLVRHTPRHRIIS